MGTRHRYKRCVGMSSSNPTTQGFITVATLHTETPGTQGDTGGKLGSKCRKSLNAEKPLGEEQELWVGRSGPFPVPRQSGGCSEMPARSLQLRVPG